MIAATESIMADSSVPDQKTVAFYIDKIRRGDSTSWEKVGLAQVQPQLPMSVPSKCCSAFAMLQDELLDVIYWWRQVIGIVFGIMWGLGPMTGLWGFIS